MWNPMTDSIALRTFRKWAFSAQGRLCFYCKHPMWLAKPAAFGKRHRIQAHHVSLFQLTAEHLHAQRDGGQDTPANIVAACAFCNNQRHAMFPKGAPDAQTYETFVLLCVAVGLWHQHAGS